MASAHFSPTSVLAVTKPSTGPPALEPTSTPFARPNSPWSTTILDAAKLPPASRQREILKLANNKLSNGYALFVHYVQPTLELRRKVLLDSGTTKKKFYKSVGKLYEDLPTGQKAFWNGEAARLRVLVRDKVITHEECVRHAGSPDQWDTYIEYAETAVAEYLLIPLPIKAPSLETPDLICDEQTITPISTIAPTEIDSPTTSLHQPLLDTLPEPFSFEPRMLYSHFAKYDLDEILSTPTRKRQLEKLHQLADLFDRTGRVLFYYYVYPRLWRRMRPLNADESIASFAQDLWRFAQGAVVQEWQVAEVDVKKMLGDGDVNGLALLRLGGLHPRVLRFHEMAEQAVGGRFGDIERSM
ncbi:uncharacterized protein RCC_04052 [Ramularia collo-cygni]|uniref:Uncharacterized protein n=1 Tax=Ramularia collo-cygni TaxID=112498 RepID=A0A2D3V9L4_9PEZI|nr:uncharacterized protein RCC_04052 [Ramularia collo-cygni]CZT18209.1 uncharacterized protein RCC_04052 [Ramularia collo-cygni]